MTVKSGDVVICLLENGDKRPVGSHIRLLDLFFRNHEDFRADTLKFFGVIKQGDVAALCDIGKNILNDTLNLGLKRHAAAQMPLKIRLFFGIGKYR